MNRGSAAIRKGKTKTQELASLLLSSRPTADSSPSDMAASSDIPMQIAETIQTAHINRAPSAAHDLNPSTAADTREPVRVVDDKKRRSAAGEGLDDEEDDDDDDIPVGVLRPQRRFAHLPPIPDLRFEQSYLHSIRDSKTWWMVAWVTARDQVCCFQPQ